MNDKRPVNLDLTKFHFPPTAIISIMHRVTGVLMYLFIPFALYLLYAVTSDSHSFSALQQVFAANFWLKLVTWLLLSVTTFHVFAGIRHLIMDAGYFETVHAGRITTYTVFVLVLVSIVLLGVWIW